jgi:hypothetical protein
MWWQNGDEKKPAGQQAKIGAKNRVGSGCLHTGLQSHARLGNNAGDGLVCGECTAALNILALVNVPSC